MAIADRPGLPLAIHMANAALPAVTLVAPTLAACAVAARPAHLIGDNADENDPLEAYLADKGIARTAPHRTNRTAPQTQGGRPCAQAIS
jgi:hypothetical protein